jgi:hypothetical protein
MYFDGRVWNYATDELTSGYLNDIKNLASNSMRTITISCGDSYLMKSKVDKDGNQLPDGKYQLVG